MSRRKYISPELMPMRMEPKKTWAHRVMQVILVLSVASPLATLFYFAWQGRP